MVILFVILAMAAGLLVGYAIAINRVTKKLERIYKAAEALGRFEDGTFKSGARFVYLNLREDL